MIHKYVCMGPKWDIYVIYILSHLYAPLKIELRKTFVKKKELESFQIKKTYHCLQIPIRQI